MTISTVFSRGIGNPFRLSDFGLFYESNLYSGWYHWDFSSWLRSKTCTPGLEYCYFLFFFKNYEDRACSFYSFEPGIDSHSQPRQDYLLLTHKRRYADRGDIFWTSCGFQRSRDLCHQYYCNLDLSRRFIIQVFSPGIDVFLGDIRGSRRRWSWSLS